MKLVLLSYVFCYSLSTLVTVCANLSIKPDQDIITRPVGSSVVITCSSSVTSSIKWLDTSGREIGSRYLNARITTDSSGSHSQKLIITNTQMSDAGRYTCIRNVSGTLQEKSIKLTVFENIAFAEVPYFQHAIINTNATIVCKVSGEPNPVVYWKFNGVKVTLGEKYLQSSVGLKVINVTEQDGGIYSCNAEIENAGLFESKTINVSVYVPPRIVRGVGKNEAVEGDDFNFTCFADGHPPPSFEFYKRSEEGAMEKISGDDRRIVLGSNSLSFRPTKKGDEGFYKCVASNNAGINESAVGLFTVHVPAAVSEFRDVSVNEDDTAFMMCTVRGDPEPVVTLGRRRQDGGSSTFNISDTRVTIERLKMYTHQFRVSRIIPEDAGNYFCVASNTLAEDIKYARIHVHYLPRIISSKTSSLVHIWADTSRNLTVYFASNPSPNASWYFGTSELTANATFKMFLGSNFSSLEVLVRDVDQTWIYGEYKCVLKNVIGQTEAHVKLKRATIPSSPEVTVLKSRATDIWLQINPPAEDGGMPILGYVVHNEGSTYEFSLGDDVRITDLKPNTFYLLTIKARNSVGIGGPKKIRIQTTGISEPSLHILKDDWQQSGAFDHRIFWKVNTTGGMPIIEYEVLYRKLTKHRRTEDAIFLDPPTEFSDSVTDLQEYDDGDHSWSALKIKDNMKHPINGLVIPDLEPKSSYMFKLRARNAIGWSAFTAPTAFTTEEATKAELELRSSRSSSLLLIIIALFASFLIIIAAIIDVLCCYCCDWGLTKAIYSKCSKSPPKISSEKQNLSLLDNQTSKEQIHVPQTSCRNERNCERGKFKKKPKVLVCEPVPV